MPRFWVFYFHHISQIVGGGALGKFGSKLIPIFTQCTWVKIWVNYFTDFSFR
jgi:hypothetical protein